MEPMFDQVQQEPGTEIYVLNDDAGNPDVLWMYELYADQDAFQAHSSSPAMMEFIGTFGGDLMGAPPELMMVTARRSKGD